jgi:hypothetical protein
VNEHEYKGDIIEPESDAITSIRKDVNRKWMMEMNCCGNNTT